jgi:hypothetical protein
MQNPLPEKFRLQDIPGVDFVSAESLKPLINTHMSEYNPWGWEEQNMKLKLIYDEIAKSPSVEPMIHEVFVKKEPSLYTSKNYILYDRRTAVSTILHSTTPPKINNKYMNHNDLIYGIDQGSLLLIGRHSHGQLLYVFDKKKAAHDVFMITDLVEDITMRFPQVENLLRDPTYESIENAKKTIANYLEDRMKNQYPPLKGTRRSNLLGGLFLDDGTKNCGIRRRGLPRKGVEILQPKKNFIIKCGSYTDDILAPIAIEILRAKIWPDVPFVKTIAVAINTRNQHKYIVMEELLPLTQDIEMYLTYLQKKILQPTDLSDPQVDLSNPNPQNEEWEERIKEYYRECLLFIMGLADKYNKAVTALHEHGLKYNDDKWDNAAWSSLDRKKVVILDMELNAASDNVNIVNIDDMGFHHQGSILFTLGTMGTYEYTKYLLLLRIMLDVCAELQISSSTLNDIRNLVTKRLYGGSHKRRKNTTRTSKSCRT